MRKSSWIKISFVLFALFIISPSSIKADVGNSGGFGGGDSGGSSGSSSGSSSSSWSGGSSNHYSGGSSSGSGPSGLLLVGLISYGVIVFLKSDRENKNDYSPSRFNYEHIDEVSTVDLIQKNDPLFSASKFKSFVGTTFVGVQDAWSNLDTQAMRPLTTDSLFKMYEAQINDYIRSGKRNVLSQQEVRDITLSNYRIDGDQEVITVRVNASLTDYVINNKTKSLLSGKKDFVFQRAYSVEFVRDRGTTSDNTNKLDSNCPNCGAPITATTQLECEYCNSLLGNSNNGWRMNKYGAWVWKL